MLNKTNNQGNDQVNSVRQWPEYLETIIAFYLNDNAGIMKFKER